MGQPIYQKIVEDIRDKINEGELKPGDVIASENALSRAYGVSRMTVRKGLAILANRGYIFSIPGKGNFVQEPDSTKYTLHYSEMDNLINSVDKCELLDINTMEPHEKIMESLKITKNKKITRVRRLFYTEGVAVAYDVKYFPHFRGVSIPKEEMRCATLPEMIFQEIPHFAMKKEIIISTQMPYEDLISILNIDRSLPLMVIEQMLYNREGKPVGSGTTHFRGDYCKLFAQSIFEDHFQDKN